MGKILAKLGCLTSIVGPLLGLLLYPKATWLFYFALAGIAVIVLGRLFAKDPSPQELAGWIERLLEGRYGGWDVDGFEGLGFGLRDTYLRTMYRRCSEVAGQPETWVDATEDKKAALRAIITELRQGKR